MGDCDNTVKRRAIRWWTRTPTKGGSLPQNGAERRALPGRLWPFRWRRAEPRSKQIGHFANQIRVPDVDGGANPSDSPEGGNRDTMSLFLRDMLVQRLDAERAAHEVRAAQDLAEAPETEVSSAALQAAELESPEPGSQLQMQMPGWKRAIDLTLIILTYPIWLPLMLVVMAAIKISSPGPIFYRQERVGFRGRTFMIFKFRSMKMHAQTSWHEWYFERLMRDGAPMTKLDAGDDRIIPWGRFLRATGLDELPQIFNVLRGEMSLVGPRPCTPLEFEKYEEWERERVNVPPGLTGYWQVNGKNRTTFQQMIKMDLFYVKNASVRLDLWIMLKTPAALFEQTADLVQQRAVALVKLDAEAQTAAARPPDGGVV
jgi:lipopolysaccharide/colanic/teichoic acid biosynthesis glycosyltransferase